MIIKEFDNGWGKEWPWKQFEISTVQKYLHSVIHDESKTVLINSVWYSQDYHDTVMSWLRQNSWDQIILVAMLDPAIPKPDWFKEFSKPVIPLGYYSGKNLIDLCAVFFADKINLSIYDGLSDGSLIDTAFLCLNRKPHWHRIKLYRQMEKLALIDRGIVTMGSENSVAVKSLPLDVKTEKLSPNSDDNCYGIPNDVVSLGPPKTWKSCFFNVVTETAWNINHTGFVSEKIYKPIIGMRPFIVYDPDGGKQWLKDRGFETYENDFLDISEFDPSDPNQIVYFLTDLSRQSRSYLQSKFLSLKEKIQFNHNQFYVYVKSQQDKITQGIQF
jgi:hypothetical protein